MNALQAAFLAYAAIALATFFFRTPAMITRAIATFGYEPSSPFLLECARAVYALAWPIWVLLGPGFALGFGITKAFYRKMPGVEKAEQSGACGGPLGVMVKQTEPIDVAELYEKTPCCPHEEIAQDALRLACEHIARGYKDHDHPADPERNVDEKARADGLAVIFLARASAGHWTTTTAAEVRAESPLQ